MRRKLSPLTLLLLLLPPPAVVRQGQGSAPPAVAFQHVTVVDVSASDSGRALSSAAPPISGQTREKGPGESSAVMELIELDRRLIDASKRKDRAVLEGLYADEFVLVNRRGEVCDKRRNIALLTSERS